MMMPFSISFISLSLSGCPRRYFTLYSSSPALLRPPLDSVSQLDIGPDPQRDRQPERDQTEYQDRREDGVRRDPEEHERADQARVDGADARGGGRRGARDHPEEGPLHDHAERHAGLGGGEARPEAPDVARPPPHRAHQC